MAAPAAAAAAAAAKSGAPKSPSGPRPPPGGLLLVKWLLLVLLLLWLGVLPSGARYERKARVDEDTCFSLGVGLSESASCPMSLSGRPSCGGAGEGLLLGPILVVLEDSGMILSNGWVLSSSSFMVSLLLFRSSRLVAVWLGDLASWFGWRREGVGVRAGGSWLQ